ncbi:Na+/H+ antiporter NhaA [Pedobacter montanisoli]|uniref:Na(+)/H(+) antiporter NhaA n=1 Tax=Pedobacter montanisoli TaxID=2923277 RepID=A0ABS9ZXH1_9SPHI|nr:Na+/H+ antiporter NhaA [Pedobacter montanisoli]MCJ0743012.1 Na+/H+ antiporter NhaA [Pedobacter montanisoli]
MTKYNESTIFQKFFNSEKTGGILLLCCVVISLGIANSSWASGFANLLNQTLGFSNTAIDLNYSISLWINDGLMAVFFLLVGLEIKREILTGELSDVKKASLPVLAALGGMIIPASIYFIINKNTETVHGWGIPMATDIAFALAIIAMLGKSIPSSLKIFLAALAIADDLGAILVIAIFYTSEIHFNYLFMALGVFCILMLLNFLKIKKLYYYIPLGIALWYLVHHSGIHATIAGVLLAFTIPNESKEDTSPLIKLEHLLTTPVNFIIMPLFALANTNITFEQGMVNGLSTPMGLGILLGLLVGKTLGITIFSYLAVKLKWAQLPDKAKWIHMIGVGLLAGIGFTMSIFIAMLSFSEPRFINEAKFAILITSAIAGISGYIFLKSTGKKQAFTVKTN